MTKASRGAWLESPRAIWLAALLAAGLGLSSVWNAGFQLDDFFQLLVLQDRLPVQAAEGPHDIYSFLDGDPRHIGAAQSSGPLPWWSHPELKIRFWRPLASWLGARDLALFGLEPRPSLIHSVLWYVASVLLAGLVLRRLASPRVAGVAVLLFAVAACHRQAVSWIASRYVLMAFVFGALAMMAHLRWRRRQWLPGLPLSILSWVLALLSGESALGWLAFVFAYEIVAGPGGRRGRSVGLLPPLLVGAVWIAVYTLQGYGTHGSGAYVNPIQDPGAFLAVLPERFLALVGCLFLGLQSDFWFGSREWHATFVGGGVVALGLVLILWRGLFRQGEEEEAQLFRWLFLGTLLALLPQTAGAIGPRSLFVPSFGGSAILGLLIVVGLRRVAERRAEAGAGLAAIARMISCWLLVAMHGVLALLLWGFWTFNYQGFFDHGHALVEQSPVSREDLSRRRVIIAATPNLQLAIFEPFRRVLEGQAFPRTWWPLSIAPGRHRLTRTTDHTLILEPMEHRLLQSPRESILRNPQSPLNPGDKIFLEGLTVEILAATSGQPTRISFTFDPPLDDPSYLFLDGNLAPILLPAPGGDVVVEQGGLPGG